MIDIFMKQLDDAYKKYIIKTKEIVKNELICDQFYIFKV